MVWKNSIYKDRFRHNYTFSSKKCLSYITAKSMSSTLQIDVFKNAKHIWKNITDNDSKNQNVHLMM